MNATVVAACRLNVFPFSEFNRNEVNVDSNFEPNYAESSMEFPMSRSPQKTTTGTNSGPDVSQLSEETISATPFPSPRTSPFRVHFDSRAYGSMISHASEDVSFEICGVLVGDWGRDPDGAYVTVRNFIRCDSAAKKFAEVTFTHESWSHINKEMDTKFQDQRIVGWYHSHPNFGIFLSDRDMFIQQNFFSGPGQIALVIDPVRKIEGVFEWHHGNAIPSAHYWIDDRVQLAPTGSEVTGLPEGPQNSVGMPQDTVSPQFGGSTAMPVGSTWLMLAGMGLFLMGWFLSDWRSDSMQRTIEAGAAARFGIWKGLRPGLEQALFDIQKDLDAILTQTKILAADHLKRVNAGTEKGADKVADKSHEDWKHVLDAIDITRQNLRHVQRLYTFTPEEYQEVQRIVQQKIMEVDRMRSSVEEPDRKPVKNEPKKAPSKTSEKSATTDKSDSNDSTTKKQQP